MITACWTIWKSRCLFVFEGKQPNPAVLVDQVLKLLMEGVQAQRSQGDQQQCNQDQRVAQREAGQPLLGYFHPPSAIQHPPSMASNRTSSPHVQVSSHGGVDPSSSEAHRRSPAPPRIQSMGQHRRGEPQHWVGSTLGTVKINCDVAWDSVSGRGGIGVVARNHEGRIIGGISRSDWAPSSVFLEANVVLFGVHLVVEKGWKSVIF